MWSSRHKELILIKFAYDNLTVLEIVLMKCKIERKMKQLLKWDITA